MLSPRSGLFYNTLIIRFVNSFLNPLSFWFYRFHQIMLAGQGLQVVDDCPFGCFLWCCGGRGL